MNRSWSEGEKKGRAEDWKGRGLAWMGQEEKGDWGFGGRRLCVGLTEEETEFSSENLVSCSTLGWVERLKANDN